MNSKKISVLIPDQCSNALAYYVIRCLKASAYNFNISMIVPSDQIFNSNSWKRFYTCSNHIDHLHFSTHTMNSHHYLHEVIQVVEDADIDIIFAASDVGFKFLSQHREKLSDFCKVIAFPNEESLYIALDKWKLYLALQQNNIPMPETHLLSEIDNFSDLKYPVLVKPTNGIGGKNIQKFDVFSQEVFQELLKNDKEIYIIQEYINGYDIDCNVLCSEGEVLAYTIQQPLGIENGFSPKIDKLKFVHDPYVLDIVRQTMHTLKWTGVAHLDLRFNAKNGDLNVIEINPRFWQSLMGSLSVGVNFPCLLYSLTNGIPLEAVTYSDKYYAKFSRFIKDVFNGSLQYSLSDTNIKYLISDLNSLLQYGIHNLFDRKINQKIQKISNMIKV